MVSMIDIEASILTLSGLPAAIDFGFSLDQINWLGNVMALVYLPVSLAIPGMVSRFGLRRCVRFCAAIGITT